MFSILAFLLLRVLGFANFILYGRRIICFITGLEKSSPVTLRVVHMWPGGLFGSVSDIRVTGNEYPSTVVPSVIRRPYKIKLASPRFCKRAKKKKVDVVKSEKQDLKSLAEFTKQLLEED